MKSPPRSFLNRLMAPLNSPVPEQPLVELVALNLENVLNTRKGTGSVIREFGLGDYERAANTHDAVLILVEEIAEQCRRYEPRLRAPEVEMLGRTAIDAIRFELRGELDGRTQLYWLDLNTSSRHVIVSIIKGRAA